MANTTTLNLRVNPDIKKQAEDVLSELGIPMSTAINMYLRQISLTGGIPFPIKLPDAPKEVNLEKMTLKDIEYKLDKGYDDAMEGRVHEASEAFDTIRKKHSK